MNPDPQHQSSEAQLCSGRLLREESERLEPNPPMPEPTGLGRVWASALGSDSGSRFRVFFLLRMLGQGADRFTAQGRHGWSSVQVRDVVLRALVRMY